MTFTHSHTFKHKWRSIRSSFRQLHGSRTFSTGLHLRDMLEIKLNRNHPERTTWTGALLASSTSWLASLLHSIELKVGLQSKTKYREAHEYYDPELMNRKFLQAIQTGLLSDPVKFLT